MREKDIRKAREYVRATSFGWPEGPGALRARRHHRRQACAACAAGIHGDAVQEGGLPPDRRPSGRIAAESASGLPAGRSAG